MVRKMLRKEFKLIVLFNALFAVFYLFWNWDEYSAITSMKIIAVKANFPFLIQFSGTTKDGLGLVLFIDSNVCLAIFLLAIFVNLYLAFRLQTKAKEG
jgi:hypothetical protein